MRGERASLVLLLLLSGCLGDFGERTKVSESEADALAASAPFPEQTPGIHVAAPGRIETRPDGRRYIRLDVREALRLALRNNQRFLVEGENLQVQLLTLEALRHGWAPTVAPLTGAVTYSTSPGTPYGLNEYATLGLSQKLPFGGTASASWTHSGVQSPAPSAYTGAGTVSLTQPILRGAGFGLAME